MRYTAVWCDNGSAPLAGVLEVGPASLRFEGRSADRQALLSVAFGDIRGFHLARAPRERLLGRPAIVLDVGSADPIRVSTPEPGALHELLDALTLAHKSVRASGRPRMKGSAETDEGFAPPKETEIKRIVVATDGSPDALTAVREGLSLAEHFDCAVTFVCVRTPSASIFAHPLHQLAIDEELTRARRAVDEAMKLAVVAGVDADYEILDGSPVEAVLDVARRLDAWLLVVGSRGRGAVQGALFGSVSRALVTHSDRPVLVARERAALAVA